MSRKQQAAPESLPGGRDLAPSSSIQAIFKTTFKVLLVQGFSDSLYAVDSQVCAAGY